MATPDNVQIIVPNGRVWVNSGDYRGVEFDLTKAMKQRFDEKGINIPFPCQMVYHVNAAGEGRGVYRRYPVAYP